MRDQWSEHALMQKGPAPVYWISSLHLVGLIILAFFSLADLPEAAENLCEPGMARRPGSSQRAMQVAASNPDMTSRVVTIRWLGHSSFLITTPGGTAVLTDPHPRHLSATVPVRAVREKTLHLAQTTLPSISEVVMVGYREGDR